MPKRCIPIPDSIGWLTGQFMVDHGNFTIPEHDPGTFSFPFVVPPQADPTQAEGTFQVDFGGLLTGKVTITTGSYQFTGEVTDGFYRGWSKAVRYQGEEGDSWETWYWFTFSGNWSTGWHSFGEVQYLMSGDSRGDDVQGGTLTMATRTGVLLPIRRRPAKRARKRALATR